MEMNNFNMIESTFNEEYRVFARRTAIERILMTPKQKKGKELNDKREFTYPHVNHLDGLPRPC